MQNIYDEIDRGSLIHFRLFNVFYVRTHFCPRSSPFFVTVLNLMVYLKDRSNILVWRSECDKRVILPIYYSTLFKILFILLLMFIAFYYLIFTNDTKKFHMVLKIENGLVFRGVLVTFLD